jgi:hypothetical protein
LHLYPRSWVRHPVFYFISLKEDRGTYNVLIKKFLYTTKGISFVIRDFTPKQLGDGEDMGLSLYEHDAKGMRLMSINPCAWASCYYAVNGDATLRPK